ANTPFGAVCVAASTTFVFALTVSMSRISRLAANWVPDGWYSTRIRWLPTLNAWFISTTGNPLLFSGMFVENVPLGSRSVTGRWSRRYGIEPGGGRVFAPENGPPRTRTPTLIFCPNNDVVTFGVRVSWVSVANWRTCSRTAVILELLGRKLPLPW